MGVVTFTEKTNFDYSKDSKKAAEPLPEVYLNLKLVPLSKQSVSVVKRNPLFTYGNIIIVFSYIIFFPSITRSTKQSLHTF